VNGSVARQATGYLATITSACAPADSVGFYDNNIEATFGKLDCGIDAGRASTNNGDIRMMLALQFRKARMLVTRGAVIIIDAFQ